MLTVVYRTYPQENNKGRPFKGTKIELIKLCFNSFLKAFEGVDIDLTVLMDKPNDELRDIFKEYKTEESFYEGQMNSVVSSLHRAINIALSKKNNFILVEDDHYFLLGAGKKIEKALETLEFVTAYDHPAHYDLNSYDYKRDVRLIDDQHWMTVLSTTHSFAGQYQALKEEAELIKSYGFRDHEMWCDVTQRKRLWCPVPSLSTHVEDGQLAPSIDWFEIL